MTFEATLDTDSLTEHLRDALRDVLDPEIGLNVVDLGLIRGIEFRPDETAVTMIMTTPFCPAAGYLIDQVKRRTEEALGKPAAVTLGDEIWDPSMMEIDISEWGLI